MATTTRQPGAVAEPSGQADDAPLLEAAQHGDREAISSLLARHQAQIYRFGLKLCRHPDDAKDVLQETMLSAARNLPGFRGQASLSTWLYTIARSFCAKRRRRSKFAPEAELSLEHPALAAEQLPDHVTLEPEAALAAKQRARALRDAVDTLSPAYKDVLVLRDMEGLTANEVAEVLGVRVEAVKSRLHRARKAVRERLMASVGPPDRAADGCPDIVGMWSGQLEGEISAADCARMQQHLEQCNRCTHACDSLKGTLLMCRAAEGNTAVPLEVQKAVQAAVHDLLRNRGAHAD